MDEGKAEVQSSARDPRCFTQSARSRSARSGRWKFPTWPLQGASDEPDTTARYDRPSRPMLWGVLRGRTLDVF